MSLDNAHKKRAEIALNKLYNFEGVGHASFRNMIDSGRFVSAEVKEVPRVRYNRTKYNRMDSYQQAEYDKKMQETKTEYRLFTSDNSFHIVPKAVYDYFINLRQI